MWTLIKTWICLKRSVSSEGLIILSKFWNRNKPMTPWITIDLLGDIQFVSGNFLRCWTSNAFIRKIKSHLHHRCICMICKLEKQFLKGVSCTENCFYSNLSTFERNFALKRKKFSNNFITGAILFKSLSVVDVFFNIR